MKRVKWCLCMLLTVCALLAGLMSIMAGASDSGNAIVLSSSENTYIPYDGAGYALTYSENGDGTLTITGYTGTAEGELVLPTNIGGRSVSEIGSDAFEYCSGFTGSLIIPDSVTYIGYDAFFNCSGFTGCLTIGNSVTAIGSNAFCYCSGFTGSLIIPDSMTTIESYAFRGCSGFTGNLVIPNSVTAIGSYAFYGCSGFIGSLIIPDSVTSIGSWAFCGCSGFTGNLVVPDSVTNIGSSAFDGCTGFDGSLTIGNSVTAIGSNAFEDCSGFTGSLTIGNSVTEIKRYAFFNCSGFTGCLTIGNSVTAIGSNAFRYCSGFTGNLVIPDSVTAIEQDAFGGCSGFTNVNIPESVTSISYGAFNGCTNLKTVYYSGNEEDWKNISIGSGNSELTAAERHYSSYFSPVGDLSVGDGAVLTFTEGAYNARPGEKIRVTVMYAPGDESDVAAGANALTWSVSDPTVAQLCEFSESDLLEPNVDMGGYCYVAKMIQALKPGTVTVSVASENGAKSERKFIVSETLNFIGMQSTDITMEEYKNLLVYAGIGYNGEDGAVTVKWTTDAPDVIAFSEDGIESVTHTYSEAGTYSESVRIYARKCGTATLTCTLWNGMSANIRVTAAGGDDAILKEMLENNWYDTPTPKSEMWETVQDYADDWNKAYCNYIETLNKRLNKVKISKEEERDAAIKRMAAEYQANDESSASKYLYIPSNEQWGKNWKEYAYRGYCTAIYDDTDSEVALKGINPTETNAIKIVNAVKSKIYTIQGKYQYGSVTVTVKLQNYAGGKMGTVTLTDGKTTRKANVVSRPEDLNGIITNYINEMNNLEYSALDNIYSAVAQDILGQPFSTFTEEWLKDEISQQTAEQFRERGFGNVRDALSYCYSYGKKIYDAVKVSEGGDVNALMNNINALNTGIDTDSIIDTYVKNKANKLDSAGKALIQALREYETGTLTPKSGWNKFTKWSLNCPVSVSVMNSSGEQIGYVSDDDLRYDESCGIYIREDSGAKTVYCQDGLNVSFQLVGTDCGLLSCSFEEYQNGEPIGRSNYYNITLAEGTAINIDVPETEGGSVINAATLTRDGSVIGADEYIPVTQSACVQITAESEDNVRGIAYGGGAYTRGDAVILHAAPSKGWRFAGWYQDDIIVSLSAVYEFSAQKDMTLTARFQAEERTFANELISVCAPYADVCDISVEQTGDAFTLHMTRISDGVELPDATLYLASYAESGAIDKMQIVNGEPTDEGKDYHGIMPDTECKIFLFDCNLAPVIKAYLNAGN